MFPGINALPSGLSLRPSRPSDKPFLDSLYRSTRDDLRQIDADEDFIETLLDLQTKAQTEGYGDQFPNAMYFVVEHLGESIGRVTLDFGSNEVRVVDIAFIPTARGRGFGTAVLRGVQATAARVMAPVTLTVAATNPGALMLYQRLGFQVVESDPMYALMAWYPTLQ